MQILGAVALSYLAGAGTVTNAAVVGRGLFRSACRAVQGDVRQAAVEALASLAAPALMSYATTASLVVDAVQAAHELAAPALEAFGQTVAFRDAS
jgi:hypothetical protein